MKTDRRRGLLILMVLSALLWVVFAQLVVPPLIRSAYNGESLSIVNSLIQAQHVNPLEHYLQRWNYITVRVLLFGIGFWLLALLTSAPAFVRRFVGEATPGSLGAIRMWVCGILLLATLLEDLSSISLLPPEVRQPKGVMGYLYALPIGFGTFVTSAGSLSAFQVLTEILLFLGMIGFGTRIVVPLGALCHLLFWGILRDYTFFWHQTLVPFYVLAVLSWARCGDGWSVDRLIKLAQGRPVPAADQPSLVYGWARYACWVVITWPYVASGLSKLRVGGWFWWVAPNMRSMMYQETLEPREYDWMLSLHLRPAPDVFFAGLGLASLAIEVFFALVLFSRVARYIVPVATAMMHVGIFLFQKILFLDLILLQLVFFDLSRPRKAIARWLETRGPRSRVLYDGACPLCRRTVRVLTALDLFERLEFVDFRRVDLPQLNREYGLSLTPVDLERDMYLIDRGRIFPGFFAYRRMALALPAFWLLAPWLFLPGVTSLGLRVYGVIARNRFNFLSCHSECPTEPAAVVEPSAARATADVSRWHIAPLAVTAVTVVMLYCWHYKIEFYPFTAMQLFTGLNDSGKITYTRVLAHRESGSVSPIRFEGGIGVLGRNARYGRVLGQCIEEPIDAVVCTKFLAATASVYNARAARGDKVLKYELQQWTWDFRANPADPTPGELTQRWVYDVRAGEDARVQSR